MPAGALTKTHSSSNYIDNEELAIAAIKNGYATPFEALGITSEAECDGHNLTDDDIGNGIEIPVNTRVLT